MLWCVGENLFVEVCRVANSLKNFRLVAMNQISLVHAAWRGDLQSSLQSSILSSLIYCQLTTEIVVTYFMTVDNHAFPKAMTL